MRYGWTSLQALVLLAVLALGGCDRAPGQPGRTPGGVAGSTQAAGPAAPGPASPRGAAAPPGTVAQPGGAASPGGAAAPPAWATAGADTPWPGVAADSAASAETEARRLMARNYYVVLDGSGSMREQACGSGGSSKMDAARRALDAFAQSVPADANLGLLAFDHRGVQELLPLGPAQPGRFAQQVQAVQPAGGTPLHSAVRAGYAALTAQGRRQLGYGEYHLVVVTDGEASAGEDPREAVAELLRRSPVVLHTIGFCLGPQHSLNQPGRTLYRAADDAQALRRSLGDVLAEAPAFDLAGFGR